MKFGLYVTYDKVGEEYSPVFQQKNDKVCCRVVHDMLKKSPISPVDYQIIKIGEFDNESGSLVFNDSSIEFVPEIVCDNCLDLFSNDEIQSLNIQSSLFSENEVVENE